MAADRTVTANFVRTYTLTTAVGSVGVGTIIGVIGTVSGAGPYDEGQVATVAATPSAGVRFAGWSGALTGLANPATVAMTGDKHVTAVFVREGWAALWWTPSPPLAGELYAIAGVTPGPGWRPSTDPNAVRRQTPGLVGVYELQRQVFVEAVAFAGYRLTGWSGGRGTGPDSTMGTNSASSVIMVQDTMLQATFVKTFTLTTACNPADAGYVYRSSWKERWDEKEAVTLTAQPRYGYVFDSWLGPGGTFLSSSNPWTFHVTSSDGFSTVYITALFRKS
jgi:hypothetical protein